MKRKAKFVVLFMVMVLSLEMLSVTANAATKKVPALYYTSSDEDIKKKAVTVKKGTTILKLGNYDNGATGAGSGYLKFKVPKKGTYAFTFSNLIPGKKGEFTNGWADLNYYNKKGDLTPLIVKTKGGTTDSIWIATKKKKDKNPAETSLKTRTGTIKLKKNQVIYIYLHFGPKDSLKLKITQN